MNIRNDSMYCTWHSMIMRCRLRNVRNNTSYGLRGIKVCDRWADKTPVRVGTYECKPGCMRGRYQPAGFLNFVQDMGKRPQNPNWWTSAKSFYSLDRIDHDGDYEPSNCRWANWYDQNKNKTTNKENVGVYRRGRRWEARIRRGNSCISEYFDDKDSAIMARKEAEMRFGI